MIGTNIAAACKSSNGRCWKTDEWETCNYAYMVDL